MSIIPLAVMQTLLIREVLNMGEQDVDVNIPSNIQWVIVGVCAVILVVMGFYSTTIGDSVRDDVRILESDMCCR